MTSALFTLFSPWAGARHGGQERRGQEAVQHGKQPHNMTRTLTLTPTLIPTLTPTPNPEPDPEP